MRVPGGMICPGSSDRSAYRVWVSEIMLQQTQVATVIPYFERFMQRFPGRARAGGSPASTKCCICGPASVTTRARATCIAPRRRFATNTAANFRSDFDAVMALPGIGRSTAGAILALATGARHAILDGNVKRVLARHYAIDGAPDENATLAQLWRLAEENTPADDVATYTQAIMDLGATLCTRGKPRCADCPIASDCRARIEGAPGRVARGEAQARGAPPAHAP